MSGSSVAPAGSGFAELGAADAADQVGPGGADLLGQQVPHASGDAGDADACGHTPLPRALPHKGGGSSGDRASLHGRGGAAISPPLSSRARALNGHARPRPPDPRNLPRWDGCQQQGDRNAQGEDQVVGEEAIQDHRDRQSAGRPGHEAPRPDQPLAEDEAHQPLSSDAHRCWTRGPSSNGRPTGWVEGAASWHASSGAPPPTPGTRRS